MKLTFWIPLILVMLASQVRAAPLLKSDFNMTAPRAWPDAAAASTPNTLHARVTLRPVGTVDAANATEPSGALLLTARPLSNGGNGRSSS